MKTRLLIFGMLFMGSTLLAQAPQNMSYQAVVRDAGGALVTGSPVGVRISIIQGSATGANVYVETQNISTNANGLLSMSIGSGTVVTGTMAGIDWSNGPYFMKTETDPAGGTSYTVSGTSQMMSVPYALYAETSGTPGTPGPAGVAGPTGPQGVAGATGAAGADGTDGITNAGFTSAEGLAPSTTADFIGPTRTVTITSGQKIIVFVSKALGSTSVGGALGLNIQIGYQSSTATAPTAVGLGMYGLRVAEDTRVPIAINGVISGIPAGTYEVGMVGVSVDAANWNYNEWGYITTIVTN